MGTTLPPPAPPAIVAGCRALRHDGAQNATTQIGSALAGTANSGPVQAIGNAIAQSAGNATVSTDVEVAIENSGYKQIVALRLGVKLSDGGFRFINVPAGIAPGGDVLVMQQIGRGSQDVGVSSCTLERVTFADGSYWYAPLSSPQP